MKKLLMLLVVVLTAACQDDTLFQDEVSVPPIQKKIFATSTGNSAEFLVTCNETKIISLLTPSNATIGQIECTVNDQFISINYQSQADWYFRRESVWAGSCEVWPEDPSDFPYQQSFQVGDQINFFERNIPLGELPPNGCFILDFELVSWYSKYDEPPTLASYTFQYVFQFEKCDDVPDNKSLHTEPQGAWGAPPNGNNAGAYLHKNFNNAFPEGLIAGCYYSVELTSAQSVTGFLPSGGKPAPLNENFVNAGVMNFPDFKNTFAGQVIALKLSIGFDNWDESFSESTTKLQNAIITRGPFEGWTVADVLAEAEKALGGCPLGYSVEELNEAVAAINESAVAGTQITGFIRNGI